MPMTRRAYQQLLLDRNSQHQIENGKHLKPNCSKVLSPRTQHSWKSKESKVESRTTQHKHPEAALRSRENEPHLIKPDKSDDHLGSLNCAYHTRVGETDEGSVSGICLSEECSSGKELIKKTTTKTSDNKKRKYSSKNSKVKPKEKVLKRFQSDVKSVKDKLVNSSSPLKKRRKCSEIVLDAPKCCSGKDSVEALTSWHKEVKFRIGLVRQHILDEQTRVERLREQLARDRHSAQASLGYRRIRIQREVQKLKEKVQSQDKKRIKLEETRIQRQLEASKRKLESDRVAMQIELAKNWREKFQQKKQEVRNARRGLVEQSRCYGLKKSALKKQLQKSWVDLQDKVLEMRDRIETEMVKYGHRWDGVSWTSNSDGKHKYSLRRVPREKTHIYCRAWKMTNKKEPESPSISGATVYKEAKLKALTELYQLLDSELRCSVCSELFIAPVVLNCSHTFCSYCINQWKRRTNWCPICRTSITARNPITKLDSFINKCARRVGENAEKKRLETIKDREVHERALLQDGRSWGNFANHSLGVFEDDEFDGDDFLNYSLSSEDSDFVNFIEILQERVNLRRYFGMNDDDDDDDDDSFVSSVDSDETDEGFELFSDYSDDFDDDSGEDDDEDDEAW